MPEKVKRYPARLTWTGRSLVGAGGRYVQPRNLERGCFVAWVTLMRSKVASSQQPPQQIRTSVLEPNTIPGPSELGRRAQSIATETRHARV